LAGREILLGIDVGTTKVAAVVGARDAEAALLGAASVPCRGLRRGIVVDLTDTTNAIREAVSRAQRMAGAELGSAWVGLTGQHMTSVNSHAEIRLARANREVGWGDVERAMAAAVSAVSVPPDRRMIHAISRGFALDDEPRVRNPVGLIASRLAVDAHIVTIPRNAVDNVAKAVEQAGVGITELVAEPLAAADAVLTEDEEELGVLMVDVGGGTSDLALFLEGSIAFTGAVPVAGNYITHDIAVALGITHPQAEELKLTHGSARTSLVADEETAPIAGGDTTVSRRFLAEVIEARVQEMFRLVAQKLTGIGGVWPPPGGVVVTGGGSLLDGLASVAEEVMGCRVRLGRPRVASGPVELLESPAFATGVGLVYYAHREAEARRADRRREIRVLPVLGRVVAWVKDLFSS